MILAYHAIFSAYGFWLPNDPRGSWSDFVASWELLLAGGRATKTEARRSLAGESHDVEARRTAKLSLQYPPVEFAGAMAQQVAFGFKEAVEEAGYRIHAGAILPDHVHLVLGRGERKVEQMVGHLKARATRRLTESGLHPLGRFAAEDGSIPTPWAERCWKVFLDSVEGVWRAIEYVEANPEKEGKRRQRWSFVTPFVPW